MDYLSESDYSELIDYLISGLRKCHADDVIRQIKELETVNVIEEASPAAEAAARKLSNPDQLTLSEDMAFEEDLPSAKAAKQTGKKLNREAVSEYRSRPMSYAEMYDASVDILETYLLSVPQILKGIEKSLALDGLSGLIWKNERMERAEPPTNIIEAVRRQTAEGQKQAEEIIKTLKTVTGKERA